MLTNCGPEASSIPSGVEIVELRDYKTIYTFKENQLDLPTLISPCIIVYDGRSNLFVYDRRRGMVVKLNGSGEVVSEYGRIGRGPGEFRYVNNIFLVQNYVYLVDHWQFFIHKYNQESDFVSSMDYGLFTTGGSNMLNMVSSVAGSGIQAIDINNQPFVTQDGNVFLPFGRDKASQAIYELRDWQGNYLSDIGEVPEGSMYLPTGGGKVYLTAIDNRETPQIFKPRAFPVEDRANPGEYFLVYSAIPKISKYNERGDRLWEAKIGHTPEVDAITRDYFNSIEKENKLDNRTSIGILAKYTSGVSSPQGDLYLATYTDPNGTFAFSELAEPLCIHKFSGKGELVRKYKLISGSTIELPSIFDIDFTRPQIFVVTSEAEIRAYSF